MRPILAGGFSKESLRVFSALTFTVSIHVYDLIFNCLFQLKTGNEKNDSITPLKTFNVLRSTGEKI